MPSIGGGLLGRLEWQGWSLKFRGTPAGGAADGATGWLPAQALEIRVRGVIGAGRGVVRGRHWEHRLRGACSKDAFHEAVPTQVRIESGGTATGQDEL